MSLLDDLHALAFYLEVAETQRVWTIHFSREAAGQLAAQGTRAWPVWSSRDRAERAISEVQGATPLELVEVAIAGFEQDWVPNIVAMHWRLLVNGTSVGAGANELESTELGRIVASAAEQLRGLP